MDICAEVFLTIQKRVQGGPVGEQRPRGMHAESPIRQRVGRTREGFQTRFDSNSATPHRHVDRWVRDAPARPVTEEDVG